MFFKRFIVLGCIFFLSKCLWQSSARGRREGFTRMGVPTQGCEIRDMQKGTNGTEQGAERSQKCPTGLYFLVPFWRSFPLKIPSKIHSKIDSEKTLKIIPKCFQNGAEIDAKTHKKSMTKLVMKKIRKIIKNHVFSEG